jgi:uncharacterized membrane protein
MKLSMDRLGTVGLFLTAIASPCCFPLFGILLASFGLGSFELFGGFTMWVFQGFVVLSVLGTWLSYRQHRHKPPLVLAILSAALILYSYHLVQADYWTYMMYAGMFGLMLSAISNYYSIKKHKRMQVELISTITCPVCAHTKREEMPTDACTYFYQCEACNTRLKPKQGDCCVFCSYGTVKCPPIQQGLNCC